MTHKSINTFIWKVNADIFDVMLPLIIIAWGKNPNKLSYLKFSLMSSEHLADSRRWLWDRYSIVMLEGDTIDARATFSKQNTATKTSLCLGMLYFQRFGIYLWSACEKL